MNATNMIDPSWLTSRTSVEEIAVLAAGDTVPKSLSEPYLAKARSITLQMLEGDELWQYASPPDTWMHMCGRGGLATCRNGEVIYAEELFRN